MDHHQEGPWPDVPIARSPTTGQFHDDRNWQHDNSWDRKNDSDDSTSRPSRNKKNQGWGNNSSSKNKDKRDKSPIVTKYECYILEKAEPLPGDKPSWRRVGKRQVHVEQSQLASIVKRSRNKGKTSEAVFAQMSSNQQGVINVLLDHCRQNERSKDADWVLADIDHTVSRSRGGGWFSNQRPEKLEYIRVIFKRQSVLLNRSGAKATRGTTKAYSQGDIIDLSDPTNKRKKNDANKKAKRSRSVDNFYNVQGPLDNPMGITNIPPPPPPPGNFQQQPMQHQEHFQQQPYMPPPPPPGPYDTNGHGQFMPPPPPQAPMPPHQQHFSARHPTQHNSFEPDHAMAAPYGEHDHEYPQPYMHDMEQTRPLRRRRSSTRRPSVGVRQFSNLENSVAALHEKLDSFQLGHSDSSEGTFDGDDRWSQDDFHDSTPRRSRSTTHHGRYRSNRYNDAQVAIYRPGGRDSYPRESRRPSGRPMLHQARTYDDYPPGGPILQRPQPQRRATEYDRYDIADPMRDHRRSMASYDYSHGWDGRRDSLLDSGRQSYHGGGNGYGF